jgi:hypothetical protein
LFGQRDSIDVRCELPTGSRAAVKTAYGSIQARGALGDRRLTAKYGNISADTVGDLVLDSAHGTIELGTTAGDVEVTTSGPPTIDHALGNVTARSAHGAIRLREVTGGSIRLENGYAGVEVGVPAGTAAWIDAASAHGAVRNELTPDADTVVVGRPRIIFLDEPTTGLDPRRRQTMWNIARELLAYGVTILLTTQYLEEADRVAVLDLGRIVGEVGDTGFEPVTSSV